MAEKVNEKLRYLITEWFEGHIPNLILRGLPPGWKETRLVFALAGVRRGGKTFLFYQMVNYSALTDGASKGV